MGFRFRRSIRIAPGIRLNMSPGGVSATLGPRGASVGIGRRGTFLNVGIPGSGLSYRQQLSGSTREDYHPRESYRQLLPSIRDVERERARLEAAEAHASHESTLTALSSVLSQRNRTIYDWQAEWASRGEFVNQRYVHPIQQFSPETAREYAARVIPIGRWVTPISVFSIIGGVLGGTITRLIIIATLGLGGWWLIQAIRLRRTVAERYLREASQEFAEDAETLRAAHQSREEGRQRQFAAEEARLARVRTAITRGDLETLSQVLEAELYNETFPVPLVVELELDSANEARIEFVLPELSEISEARTQITKTGRLSSKRMAQRDRIAIYNDLCTGMALRLCYETFRVLVSVQTVEIFGTMTGIDPSTGRLRQAVALHVRTTRPDLEKLNLDLVDASSAFDHLGGRFNCDKKGQLSEFIGVTGLTEE